MKTFVGESPYIHTYTGEKFFFDDIEGSPIKIEDIAHALSNNCRWTGHTRRFYSVAEHCLNVASMLPERLQLAGLLHDASEAYVHDTPNPLKVYLLNHGFTAFKDLEKRIEFEIFKHFCLNLTPEDLAEIKTVDIRIGLTEAAQLMAPGEYFQFEGGPRYEPYSEDEFFIGGMTPEDAEFEYLEEFNYYMRRGR